MRHRLSVFHHSSEMQCCHCLFHVVTQSKLSASAMLWGKNSTTNRMFMARVSLDGEPGHSQHHRGDPGGGGVHFVQTPLGNVCMSVLNKALKCFSALTNRVLLLLLVWSSKVIQCQQSFNSNNIR